MPSAFPRRCTGIPWQVLARRGGSSADKSLAPPWLDWGGSPWACWSSLRCRASGRSAGSPWSERRTSCWSTAPSKSSPRGTGSYSAPHRKRANPAQRQRKLAWADLGRKATSDPERRLARDGVAREHEARDGAVGASLDAQRLSLLPARLDAP